MPKKKVLIVDDETEFVDMIQMRLEANDYDVIAAHDGQAGFDRAQSDAPNIILLDVMMPGMDGFETLRKLRKTEKTRNIPVVMLTARGESSAIFKAQGLSATDYLIKPCDSQELLATVKKYA
ncbi:MAG: response regulator [Lentisphaerae bacterium]|nr:response regulator [Lentisphaerota bacterium]